MFYLSIIHKKYQKFPGTLLFAAILLLSVLLQTGCSQQPKISPVSESGFYFDTVITLTLYESDWDHPEGISLSAPEDVFTEVFALCERYEQTLSRTIEGSDIWNVNHAGGNPTPVSEDTFLLLQTALAYAELSGGLVDPTIAPATDLWDFSSSEHSLPDTTLLTEACTHIDYRNIILDEAHKTVTLADPAAALDLGFIAKGYIADRIRDYLRTIGIEHAIINLGGNVLCIGNRPDNTPYRIAIRQPFGTAEDMAAVLACSDQSIVTSGVYERYFYMNDTLYHHMLNPGTGYPVLNGLLSVTIVSEDSVSGDALSTLCYLLGLEDGLSLIESLPDTEALFISDDYSLHYSSGLSE